MDINRKIEIAKLALKSISRHDDADSIVRCAALDHLVEAIVQERAELIARAQAKIG